MLFPLGVGFALWGTLVWPLAAAGVVAYPGTLHRALMMQGFELSFVLGFLLTAMPGFTRGPRVRGWELAGATAIVLALAVCAAARAYGPASWCGAAAVAWAALAVARRALAARALPPEEFGFVGFGLAAGAAGMVWNALAIAGLAPEPAPWFGQRLVSLGMVLALVLGLGALLVPAFAGMADPLAIPGIARAHERRGRRALYLPLLLLLAGSFAFDAYAHPGYAAALRAVVATLVVLWVWKLPAPASRFASPNPMFPLALRIAGACTLLGLWLAVLAPARALAGEHVVFVAGYGLLTMTIATRVVVSHGRHAAADERALLPPWQVVALLVAAAARAAGEYATGAARDLLLGVAGALWGAAWIAWALAALPRILHPRPAATLVAIANPGPRP